MYAAACGQGQALPLTQGAALHIFLETVHHSMPRTSPVFYIAPSAISITPNANGSADDLAVYVARGAKIRVYSPGCGIGTTDASFQEWSFAGRNRRLRDSAKEYTVYGRLSKTDRTKGYLVFAPKVGGLDKYPWVTLDGLATGTAGQPTDGYWYVRMGDVSLPVGGERTVTLDTGILGTDQFNTEWNLDPDDMPLRVQIAVTVDGQDAGPTPYVPWGSDAVLSASLVEGWDGDSHATVDRWEIVRNTGQDGDSSWPDAARRASFASTGRIDIRHSRQGGDDLAGAVSASFFVTCYGWTEEGGEVTAIASAGVTIMAETQEKYELVLSSSVMGYSPITGEYTPSEGIAVRVRATDQKGDVTKIALARLEQVRLSAEYGVSGGDEWMPLEFTDGGDGSAVAMIPVTAFASQRNLDVRLLNQAGAEIHTATIAFVKDGEDSREREWIFLRSAGQITFGDDPQDEHPKPSVIAGGEVEPQGAASGDDTDKDQDGWVPEGWWDEPQGTDETLRYEYASYRDYIHEGDEEGPDGRVPGHWGEFTSPVVWSYRAEDGVSYRCRFMLGERETWQLVQAASGALYGDLPFTATLMRRRGNGQEEEMPEAPTVITVTFEGLDKTYVLDAVRPQLVVSETENPGMIQHLNDASLISMTVAFATGGETFQYNIPALRRADGETWWRWDPITDTIEFLKTISRAVIHNLNVTGVFDAIKGYIDDLRSHNYQSGMLDGSGFRLTADNGEGSSELEVDFLKVRKKATFMELEIREETFVGGNQHYSPAGSVIYRVEYMDEQDQGIGYTVMKVPFLLKRFAFLGRVFNYAARKRIRRQLSPDEWRRVHHFRCYLLADDGTTATRNWWKVGDQPRCQTFNKAISSANKRANTYNWKKDHLPDDPATPMPDYTTIEGPFETAYYWRLCSNVGSEKLDDGHVYDFIDMPYEGWSGYSETEKRSFRDGGSGIPVAGDTIVCIGNRTDESRMNVVSLYTSGSDNHPPAIKGYRGIHTFSFENTLVWEMSPEQFLVRSKAFKLLDDSGYQFPMPLERGEWVYGQRYHWYDRVSWKGCIWLCQVLDIYVWENANGTEYQQWQVEDIEFGEGNFTYSAHIAGDEIVTGTDHYYKKGKVGGQTVYYIRLYTYSEPDKDNDLWLREVEKGRNGIDGDGVEFVFARTAENKAPYITTSSDTDPQGRTYLDDDYLPMSSVGRTTDDPVGPSKSLPYEWSARRVMGDPDPETGTRTWNKYNERIGIAGGEMKLWATYTESSVRLDLSNEMDMVQTDRTGKPVAARTVTTVARLFDGTTEIQITPRDLTVSGGDLTPTKTADGKGVLLTWTFSPTAYRPLTTAWEVNIGYAYKGETYKAVFTIAPSLGEVVWQLKPDMSAIPFQRGADNVLTPASRGVGLKLIMMDHDNTREFDSVQSGIIVRYAFDAMPASSSAGTGWSSGAITVTNDKANLFIALFNSSGTMLDRETVPVIKDGEKGQKGDQGFQGRYEQVQYAISAYKTAAAGAGPADCGESDWKTTAPVPSVYRPFVWKRTRTYDPATGSFSSWSYIRETGEDGAQGKTGLWYRYLGVWGVDVTSVTNTNTVGYYVKYGANFYMNVKDAGVPNTTEPSASADGWEVMNSVFEYFMTKVTFADSAYLGSFIINGDWMISQHGKVDGSPSTDYERFDPNDMSSRYAFIPNFAVDGRTGKVYANDFQVNGVGGAYVKINSGKESAKETAPFETSVTILDSAGLYSMGTKDGFRLVHGNSGVQLQRWNPVTSTWGPFYAGRSVRMIYGQTYLSEYDDYIIADDGEYNVYLPQYPFNGKTITIKNKQSGIEIYAQGSDRIVLDNDHQNVEHKDLDSYDRAELVYYNSKWYWSYMET